MRAPAAALIPALALSSMPLGGQAGKPRVQGSVRGRDECGRIVPVSCSSPFSLCAPRVRLSQWRAGLSGEPVARLTSLRQGFGGPP